MATSVMPLLFPEPLVSAAANPAPNAAEAAFYLVINPTQVPAHTPQSELAGRALAPSLSGVAHIS